MPIVLLEYYKMKPIAIAVTTHGAFVTQKDAAGVDRPVTFKVPAGINVHFIPVSAPAVCTYSTSQQIDQIINVLLYRYCQPNNLSEKHECTRDIDDIPASIKFMIPHLKTHVLDSLRGLSKKEVSEMTRTLDKTLAVKTFSSGSMIPEKEFSRSETDVREAGTEYDFRVNIVSKYPVPDLMGDKQNAILKLSVLVESLAKKGYTDLILYDFSCGVANVPQTSRGERALARELLKGKSRRRQTKKTKTRRAKKRTIQWRL
jgi:hypothetical protein